MLSGLSEVADSARNFLGRCQDHRLVDQAAKIAYYGCLSLFPLVLLLFALTGLLGGREAFEWAMVQLQSIMPRAAAEYFGGYVFEVVAVERPEILSFSLVFLLFSASSAVVAMIDSFNVIFEIDEGRPLWRKYSLAIASVLAVGLFYLVGLPAIFAGPALLGHLGPGWLWTRLHWPLVFTLLTGIVWLAYRRLPNHRLRPSALSLLVGALVGTGLWAAVTMGLQIYLVNFDRFANIYGVVTGMMVLLVWMHVSALAILLGAQIAAILVRRVERVERR